MREIWKISNNKTTVVEYRVAYCKQISLGFYLFSPYTNNFTSKSNKTEIYKYCQESFEVFFVSAQTVASYTTIISSIYRWNKENPWFAIFDSFWRSYMYVVMHLRLQITETSSFV